MSFKDITFDSNTNSILFRSRKADQKPLKVPMMGFVPIGAVIPICSHLAGSYNCSTTTAADAFGFVQCNGFTINDTSSPMHGSVVPDINGVDTVPVFLRGSTTPSSTKAGSDTHTIASANLPLHTHGATGLTNVALGSNIHTHGAHTGGAVTATGSTHSHAGNGTYYCAVTGSNYGGSGVFNLTPGQNLTITATDGSHSHGFTQPDVHTGVELGHNHTIQGSTADGGFTNTAISNIPKYLSVKYIMRIK